MQFPHCRRCRLLGRECPGYPDTWDVSFRMQNEYAEDKVQTRVKKVKAGRKAHSESVTVGIPSGVNVAVEVHSWNRFYHDYVVDSGIAAFNFLPKFYTGDSSVHLCEALQAVTVASAAQQLQQSGLMVRARSHYGKAIMKLNTALDNKKSNADDSVLITLFLLSLFETVVPGYFRTAMMDKTFQCHIHVRGILTVLQLRVQRAQKSELDEAIFAFICHIYPRLYIAELY
uniref:Zn(2)-C6 fungal-type domain-containing protein n=1 Tax=Bionectria ochroleuca TaxID=29856 RepID=A0A0B7KG10_BIOOC